MEERIQRPNMSELQVMIPSVEDCFLLMKKYGMLENIRAHSIVVAKISKFIAKKMKENGMNLSLEKTLAGALMHDIAEKDFHAV